MLDQDHIVDQYIEAAGWLVSVSIVLSICMIGNSIANHFLKVNNFLTNLKEKYQYTSYTGPIHKNKDQLIPSPNEISLNKFFIGEATHKFTALMFLITLKELYCAKQLTEIDILNSKAIDLFPNSKLLMSIEKPWVKVITIKDLLTGSANIESYLKNPIYNLERVVEPRLLLNVDVREEKSEGEIAKNEPKLPPHTEYYILGKILEEIHGATYDKIFTKIIKGSEATALINGCAKSIQDSSKGTIAPNSSKIEMANLVGNCNVISTANGLYNVNQAIDELLKGGDEQVERLNISNLDNSFTSCGKLGEHTTLIKPIKLMDDTVNSYCIGLSAHEDMPAAELVSQVEKIILSDWSWWFE